MARETPLTRLLGIEHPLIQAPMGNIAGPELVGAVSGAGGLGFIGSAVLPPDEIVRQADLVRRTTDRPFGLNFFCHTPPRLDERLAASARAELAPLYGELGIGEPPEASIPPIAFAEAQLEAALAVRPMVVSFHFGLPDAEALAALRDAGTRILASATTVGEGEQLAAAGVDAVIAQGAEAGGHRGSFLVAGDDGPVGTMSLVPQVMDALDVPVVAAGGIADGRGVAAALALGAAGVQLGTAFLACPEARIPAAYRRALASTRPEQTTITRAFSGRPARAIRNRITEEVRVTPPAFPIQRTLTGPLDAASAESDSPDFLSMWAGQGAPLARELPAAELVGKLMAEAERVLAGLTDKPLPEPA